MVARTVRMQLKSKSVAAFPARLQRHPPLLANSQASDEMAFVVPGGTAALSSSVWDQQETRRPLPAAPIRSGTLVPFFCERTELLGGGRP